MKNPITIAWEAILRLVRPDVDAIIATFLKAQSKLEQFIERETAILASEKNAIEELWHRVADRNIAIDRAYQITHNLSKLTA